MNKMFLIVLDPHSMLLEIKIMISITYAHLIIELKEIYSYHGLGDQIVSDNGPSLTSQAFEQFCSANGIEHTSGYIQEYNDQIRQQI